ncbi:uncharacterized protein C8A04DRAFT_38662 [Dichotomopilus funicola]|uniref:Putative lipoate-protein ligase A n=1 Tax=Dichotomopilus funicola TaxID=1934379 RepID=A0AAN6UZB7_9PEZI|nr:hypothetical protein C8A04DRAFT_38662 [Dichotomopilus funicola]
MASSSRLRVLTHSAFYTQEHLARPVQIYRSTSSDPYINLSLEHHLLQNSHPDSTILFIYTNRPCIVIGRNQNPWLEVNLRALRRGLSPEKEKKRRPIALVRRRSGGGTVFHDEGNTNYSVICPPRVFDRDRHAEMVARALGYHTNSSSGKGLGIKRVRVNERHDIVVDIDDSQANGDGGNKEVKTFKISGSAYKLTRTRSLHHGTCLLQSPNLAQVSALLRSPAEGFIKARGVESVRSPIRNVGVAETDFVDAVVAEFKEMYSGAETASGQGEGEGGEVMIVTEKEALAIPSVVAGVRELASPEWIFGQTPQFTFSTRPTEDDPRERPDVSRYNLPDNFQTHLTLRHALIQSATLTGLAHHDFALPDDEDHPDTLLSHALLHTPLHHISDWRTTLRQAAASSELIDGDVNVDVEVEEAGVFLNEMFGVVPVTKGEGGDGDDEEGGSLAFMVVQGVTDGVLGLVGGVSDAVVGVAGVVEAITIL